MMFRAECSDVHKLNVHVRTIKHHFHSAPKAIRIENLSKVLDKIGLKLKLQLINWSVFQRNH